MAWSEEIQKAESVIGDIGNLVAQGKGIWDQLFPAKSVSLPDSQPPPEPVAATKAVSGGLSLTDNPALLIAMIVIGGYLLLAK